MRATKPPVLLMARIQWKTSQPADPFSHSSGHCSAAHSIETAFFSIITTIYLIFIPQRIANLYI